MLRRKFNKKHVKSNIYTNEVLGNTEKVVNNEKDTLEDLVTGDQIKLDNALNLLQKNKRHIHVSQEDSLQAAWHDEDDEDQSVLPSVSWALPKRCRHSSDSDASDIDVDTNNILTSTGDYRAESTYLPKGTIVIKRCPDANKDGPMTGKIKTTEFHPSAQVILVAGMSQNIGIFQVDGKDNPKIQSLFLEKFPVHCAHFSQNGQEVYLGSRAKGFYSYDMIAGRMSFSNPIRGSEHHNTKHFEVSPDGQFIAFLGSYGHINLVSSKSKEWIGSLKMNGSVEAVAFSSDGSQMFSFGDDGEVYVWDMATRSCVHRFVDDGCFHGTAIAASRDNKYIATGCGVENLISRSYSGVVNLYDKSCLSNSRPSPLKAFMNLTTPCTFVVFNPTSEVLAVTSDHKEKAIKLIHVSSLTAFSNFPEKTDSTRIVTCCDFSTNSGYMAAGNHKGQALLYRVKHYGSY